MNDTVTIQNRRDVDQYGLTTVKAKPAPTYRWLNLPAGSLTGQESYLISLLGEIQRDIHRLARHQYTMPRGKYNGRMGELYERKRVLTAVFNPYNAGKGSKGHPTLGCTWMRSASE